MHLRTHVASANARVMSAIEPVVETMPPGIVKPTTSFAVLAGSRRFAGKQIGRPSAVMGLQAQSIVRGVRGQLQQPV